MPISSTETPAGTELAAVQQVSAVLFLDAAPDVAQVSLAPKQWPLFLQKG